MIEFNPKPFRLPDPATIPPRAASPEFRDGEHRAERLVRALRDGMARTQDVAMYELLDVLGDGTPPTLRLRGFMRALSRAIEEGGR